MSLHTIAHTRNPPHSHIFTWKIENLSKFSEPLIGPEFQPIPFCAEKFHFEVCVQEFEQNSVTECLLEVFLHVVGETPVVEVPEQPSNLFNFCQPLQNENARFGSVPRPQQSVFGQPRRLFLDPEHRQPKTQAYNCSCEITLSNTNGKVLTSAKNQLMNVKHHDSLVRRVLFTSLKKNLKQHDFLDLSEDKLNMKAIFSISGYDTQSFVSSSMLTTLPVSHCELVKDLKALLETGYAHDMTFSVDGKTIKGHRSVIGCRSPILAEMFLKDDSKSVVIKDDDSKSVVIEDVGYDVFKIFLIFLYTSEINDKSLETIFVLYELAVRFKVQSLRDECYAKLTEAISMGSFYRILTLANQHADVELKKTAKNFCRRNFDRVIETEEWSRLLDSDPGLASYVMKSVRKLDPPVPPEAKKINYHKKSSNEVEEITL